MNISNLSTDEVMHSDNANLRYKLLDQVLIEFAQYLGDPPGYDNANVMPEVEALYDPATYEYQGFLPCVVKES